MSIVADSDHGEKATKALGVSPAMLQRPSVAWPTVALFSVSAFVIATTISMALAGTMLRWLAVLILAFAIFVLFTPMHDCSHGAVSRDYPWLNGAIGRVCGIVFCAPFTGFRFAHLQHHKHTNDPENDPDYWSARGYVWQLPLRWATQELHYYVAYLAHIKSRPIAEVTETLLSVVAIYYGFYRTISAGYFFDLFTLWLLPLRLAIVLLACTFDYIPHRPHKVQRHEDAYATTSRIEGIWKIGDVPLSIVLLYQNYHNIHHLFPAIPFYKYAPIWWSHRDELLRRGTPVVTMWDSSSSSPPCASNKKL